MKPVKNLVFAALLVIAICLNTFAGEQQMPNAVPTPTPNALTAYEDGTSTLGYPCIEQTGEITAETTNLFFEALAALLSVY